MDSPREQPRSSADSAFYRRVWAPVTIRVAWELMVGGAPIDSELLDEAREHALSSISSKFDPPQAEERAGFYAREYLDRAIRSRYRPVELERSAVEPQHQWRQRLVAILDDLGEAIFQLHYGDGLSMDKTAAALKVDNGISAGSREGVRGGLRSILRKDGVTLADGETIEIDRLLRRLAILPAENCDGGANVLEQSKSDHVRSCPRCIRAMRLIKAGRITAKDLVAPASPFRVSRTTVMALHLHPDVRHKRDDLYRALGCSAVFADEDTLLLDPNLFDNLSETLWELAQEGEPARHHLRGAVAKGPGAWSSTGLLGPVATKVMELTRSRQWGEVDTIGPLPEPLPGPPPAGRWWLAALLTTLVAVLMGLFVMSSEVSDAAFPIRAEFSVTEESVSVSFDIHDDALIAIVVQGAEGLEVIHQSNNSVEKGQFATGLGDYRLDTDNARMMLVSSPTALDSLSEMVLAASGAVAPLDSLATQLKIRYPEADLTTSTPFLEP